MRWSSPRWQPMRPMPPPVWRHHPCLCSAQRQPASWSRRVLPTGQVYGIASVNKCEQFIKSFLFLILPFDPWQ